MNNQEFISLLNNLNPAQRTAVEEIEGSVMVVAGPGTGKTQILTLRIANILIKTQVNPENILALTFSESGALAMRKRLLAIIGNDAYRVEITTFHAFCNNFIKNHQEEFSHLISSSNLNEIEQLAIVQHCVESVSLQILRPLGDPKYYFKPLLKAINELKQENVTPALLEQALVDSKSELDKTPDLYHDKGPHKGKMKSAYQKLYQDLAKNQELLLVFKKYQQQLFAQKKYDYNDMLLEVIQKLTSHPYLLQALQEQFQYFLVDEHQDTNAAQNKIIELLCNYFPNPNLFVVGDEKQAIFRFQGASLENFLYFKKLYPQAKLINLTENYRSTQTILDATYSLILHNPKSTQILSESFGLIKQASHPEEKIAIAKFNSFDTEYAWIADKIKTILNDKTIPAHEIAVLARNNRELDPLIDIFDNLQIPYIVESDNNILDDLDVQKLILLLRVVAAPLVNRDEYLKQALLLDCFKIYPLDVFKLIRASYEQKISLWQMLQDKKMLTSLQLKSKSEIVAFVNLFLNEESGLIKTAFNQRLDKVFVDTLNKSGLMRKILAKPHAQEILWRMTELYNQVKEELLKNPAFSLEDFLQYLNLLEENDISLQQTAQFIPHNLVRLLTVHKAKGLEFDCVFVINVFDGHWGNSRKRGSLFHLPWEQLGLRLQTDLENDQNTDERRLFYVALTRARQNLCLVFPAFNQDGKEQLPSQFIHEMPEELLNNIDVSQFEQNRALHKENIFFVNEQALQHQNSLLFSQEYIAQLFRRQGLSVSALNNFIKCPWKFFFNNLIRLPEVIEPAGLFGNAIHFALNQYIVNLQKGKANADLLLNFFKDDLSRQPLPEQDKQGFLERGKTALEGYYKQRMMLWKQDLQSEVEIRGIRLNEDIFLNGKLDMIMPIQKNAVDVYDFKTGVPKSRNVIEGSTKGSDGNYKRQLIFYKLLLDRFRNGFYKMQTGVIEFIEPNEQGVFKQERFIITAEEAQALLKAIEEVGKEIVSFSFVNKKCADKKCKYCQLRSYLGN